MGKGYYQQIQSIYKQLYPAKRRYKKAKSSNSKQLNYKENEIIKTIGSQNKEPCVAGWFSSGKKCWSPNLDDYDNGYKAEYY